MVKKKLKKLKSAAEALFAGGADMSNVPTVTISKEDFGTTFLIL